MNYSKLSQLPLGSIKAEGFLKEQLIRSKNGMGGHLPEIEPGMIADPYIKKTYVKRWDSGNQEGWGAEISGNYYTGLVQLAFTLNDAELIKKAEEWVNSLLANRLDNGYLGTYTSEASDIYDDFNAWGTASGMRALLFYYEATGREDVFDAVYKCMLWFIDKWSDDKKTCYAGQYIIEPMIYCYHKTGDKRLIDFCEDYQRFLCENTIFANSYKDFLSPTLYYNSNHTAAYGVNVRMPALMYTATGNEDYLKASENGIDKIYKKGVHLSGGPVSITEYVGPVSAVAETEYCCFTYFQATYAAMNSITGKALYGDMAEEIVYNGAQGARKKDERAIAYLSSPNQMFATVESSPAVADMQVYSPCYPVSCCPVNSVVIMPEFVRGMAQTDKDGNLYISSYGPISLNYGGWALRLNTEYPFKNSIKVSLESGNGASLFLKIPRWCKRYEVTVDGHPIEKQKNSDGYIEIEKCSGKRDIRLELCAELEIIHVDDSDASNKHPIAFKYGTLLFSLPIEESWNPFYPETETPLSSEWPWYNVNPIYKKTECRDVHERLGKERDNFTWNVALDENISKDDVKLCCSDMSGYPWEKPPIKLVIPAYKAPYAVAPYAKRAFEPFEKYLHVTDKLEIVLIPYGATNLRITYFPLARKEEK